MPFDLVENKECRKNSMYTWTNKSVSECKAQCESDDSCEGFTTEAKKGTPEDKKKFKCVFLNNTDECSDKFGWKKFNLYENYQIPSEESESQESTTIDSQECDPNGPRTGWHKSARWNIEGVKPTSEECHEVCSRLGYKFYTHNPKSGGGDDGCGCLNISADTVCDLTLMETEKEWIQTWPV